MSRLETSFKGHLHNRRLSDFHPHLISLIMLPLRHLIYRSNSFLQTQVQPHNNPPDWEDSLSSHSQLVQHYTLNSNSHKDLGCHPSIPRDQECLPNSILRDLECLHSNSHRDQMCLRSNNTLLDQELLPIYSRYLDLEGLIHCLSIHQEVAHSGQGLLTLQRDPILPISTSRLVSPTISLYIPVGFPRLA